jgi:DNA-3-methyladenine glycosylase
MPTRRVARRLLGAWFIRRWRGKTYGARIVEVEAYLGTMDRAAHTYGGRRTPRVAPMWGDGGLLYVYQVYGMHFCANVVARTVEFPEAVLIRAASHPDVAPGGLRGPGKFCRAFGIKRKHSGLDMARHGEFEIRLPMGPVGKIARGPRIGIAYAGAWSAWPLRYFLVGEPAVSGRLTSSPSS